MVSKTYCDLCGEYINESIFNNNQKVTIGENFQITTIYENVCRNCIQKIKRLKN